MNKYIWDQRETPEFIHELLMDFGKLVWKELSEQGWGEVDYSRYKEWLDK